MAIGGVTNLPAGWSADEVLGHGVDLYVPSSRRKYLVAPAVVLAVLAGWKTLSQWNALSKGGIAPWVALTVFLTLFACWCAFGSEVWRLETNSLVHRIGVRSWGYSRRYQDADLQIVVGRSIEWSVPFFRLYSVMNGKRHFLFQRREEELQQLASFIARHTGWRILP